MPVFLQRREDVVARQFSAVTRNQCRRAVEVKGQAVGETFKAGQFCFLRKGRKLAGDSPARFGVEKSIQNADVQVNQQRRGNPQRKETERGTGPGNPALIASGEARKTVG